jgi:hypothetical protein
LPHLEESAHHKACATYGLVSDNLSQTPYAEVPLARLGKLVSNPFYKPELAGERARRVSIAFTVPGLRRCLVAAVS